MTEDPGGEDPCFAPLLIGGHLVDPRTVRDVARFRHAERERLYALRRQTPSALRQSMTEIISDRLGRLDLPAGSVVSAYWPIRGELDLRPWLARLSERGVRIALPVVVARGEPLAFRPWFPGSPMMRGLWNIPVPAEEATIVPDVVIAPLLGVDRAGFRLGNGGGYFDRTLAILSPREIVGVGASDAVMETIFPMPWDIPMTRVFLGDGTEWRPGAE